MSYLNVYVDNRVKLVDEMELRHSMVWDHLIEMRVITIQGVESIRGKSTCNADEVRELLAYMTKKSRTDYMRLREALVKCDQQHIVDLYLPEVAEGSYSDTMGATGGAAESQSTTAQQSGSKESELAAMRKEMAEMSDLLKKSLALQSTQKNQEEEVVVELRNQELQIYKKNLTGPRKAVLDGDRWQHLIGDIKPRDVKTVYMKLVNINNCNKMWEYIERCVDTRQLLLLELCDSSPSNQQLIQGLSKALSMLVQLRQFDLQDTKLREEGRGVFTSISSPHLRVLSLERSNLSGCGSQIAACLTRLPQLGYLSLHDTSLDKDEIKEVVAVLPSCCPHLSALLLAGLDLTTAALDQVVMKLTKLKILDIQKSILNNMEVLKITDKTARNIEILTINDIEGNEGPLDDIRMSSLLKERTDLEYLRLSQNQFTQEALVKLEVMLNQHGGRLFIWRPGHQHWDDFIGHYDRIRDEYLKD